MNLGAPQLLIVALMALELGIHLGLHGKPKEGRYNFGYALISVAITISLLLWGGFFSKP